MDKSRPKLIFDEWNYSGILEAISMGIERRIDGRIDITVKLKCNAARYRYIYKCQPFESSRIVPSIDPFEEPFGKPSILLRTKEFFENSVRRGRTKKKTKIIREGETLTERICLAAGLIFIIRWYYRKTKTEDFAVQRMESWVENQRIKNGENGGS